MTDFDPPYHLGAFGCALLGTWAEPPAAPGFDPFRWRGGYLGAALVLRYDRPPPDHPAPYNEVILAHVVRHGVHFAALPFDLVLDNAFFVDAGVEHYHLPKRLDPTLQIELAGRRITCTGADVAFDAELGPLQVPGAKGIVSLLLRGFTSLVPIIGAASEPFLRSIIGVRPDAATSQRLRNPRFSAGGRTLEPLAGFFWRNLAITVGVPAPLAR